MDEKLAKEILEKTKNDFNRIASDFSRTRKHPWPELTAVFQGYVKEGDKVLDVGCGNGRLLDLFKDKMVNYLGIDNSEEQIKEAKKKYPKESFLVADASDLPFSDNFFDKVFLVAVFHEIPSLKFRQQVLKETRRVLRDKGLLFLSVWDLRNRIGLILKYSFLKMIGRSKLDWKDVFIPWNNKIERYYHVFSKKEIIKLVEDAGFSIVRTGIAKKETGKKANIFLIAEKNKDSVPIA